MQTMEAANLRTVCRSTTAHAQIPHLVDGDDPLLDSRLGCKTPISPARRPGAVPFARHA
jgi:hypothetical protein